MRINRHTFSCFPSSSLTCRQPSNQQKSLTICRPVMPSLKGQWSAGKASASVPSSTLILCADPDPVTGDMESAMAVHLNPWVEYEFRVVASNAIGTGDPSAPSRAVRTKEAGRLDAPARKPVDGICSPMFYFVIQSCRECTLK